MPRGDRTGPVGAGPMTGRGAGLCAGSPTPGYMNPVGGPLGHGRGFGRGFGFGRGWGGGWFGRRGWFGGGRGWRHRFWATGMPGWGMAGYGHPGFGSWSAPWMGEPTAAEEMELLREQAEILKQELKDINERMGTLEKARAQEKTQKEAQG